MNELQKTMSEIYHKNIQFLKKNYFNIYNKILDFEKNLIETYHIDYINNHFELVQNNEYTYNCDPFYDAQYRAKNIFNNDNLLSLIDTSKYVSSYGDIDEEMDASKFINEYIDKLKNIDIQKDKTNKFIFMGTLLGIHLNDIHKIINSKIYLIIEPNIEIFRLSLFLTDYEQLNNDRIFFAINENDSNLKIITNKFLKYKSSFNNHIRFEVASKNEVHLVSQISEFLTLENKIRYPFSEYLYSLKRGLNHLNNSDNGIINISQKSDFLKDIPILFLAAGPSLGDKIKFLKSSENKFLIVAASAILKFLEKENIIPDIIISIDAGKSSVSAQFDVKKEFYKDSIIIASIKTDPEVYEIINNKNIFFIQTTLELLTQYGILTGVTVGDIGLKILLSLGANNIYLLGLDAAINQKTGETHFSAYQFKAKIDLTKENNYLDYLISVKGNFQDKVKTTLLYKDMIESINSIDTALLKDSNIYNLSDGAYFENTKSTKLLNLNTSLFKRLDKTNIKIRIKNNLKTISKKELPQIDKSEFKKDIKIIKKIQNSNNKIKEFNKLQNNYQNSLTIQIIEEFFQLTNPYSNLVKDDYIQNSQFERILKGFERIYFN